MSGFPMDKRNFTSKSSRGAASELFACAYLLAMGYHVFRSVSPAAPCDLVVFDTNGVQRVEIKSASFSGPQSVAFSRPSNQEWDLLIIVGPDGQCFLFSADSTYEEQINGIRAGYGLGPGRTMAPRLRSGIELAA